MTQFMTRQILRAGATALMLSTVASVSVFVTADAAYAERGGNGNGNSSNRDRDRTQSTNRGNGRGALASELKGLNAAHANQNALENASPNSMPGKLYLYQGDATALAAAQAAETAAADEVLRLASLTDAEKLAEFMTADGLFDQAAYDTAVLNAGTELTRLEGETTLAEDAVAISLAVATGGRTLSEAALAELNRLLGL